MVTLEGSSMAIIGPESICGIPKNVIKEHSPKLTAKLLSSERKSVKAIVSLLTGHYKNSKYMADETVC